MLCHRSQFFLIDLVPDITGDLIKIIPDRKCAEQKQDCKRSHSIIERDIFRGLANTSADIIGRDREDCGRSEMDLGGGNQNDHFVFTVNTFDANGRTVFRHIRNTGGDNFERDGRIDFKLDIFFNLIAPVGHDDLENTIVTAV